MSESSVTAQKPVVRMRPGMHFKGEAEARIESMSHDLSGVAHVDGKAVFIEGALPGELVRYGITRRKSSFDKGITLEILEVSAERVLEPPCEYFGICGGCSLQHLENDAQLKYKQTIVKDNFNKIGNVSPEQWLAPIQGPSWAYRRKARLGVRLVPKKGGVLVGFREKNNSYITNLKHCHVLDERIARLLPVLQKLINGLSCPDRIPQVEVAAGDSDVTFVFRHLVALTAEDREALRQFEQEHNIQVLLQPGGPESIQALEGAANVLEYTLPEFDIDIAFRATDFTQVNIDINRQMVHRAVELLDLNANDRVLDLFSGLGNFTLPIARRCSEVLGIEGDAALIQGAEGNAARNGVANAHFRKGDLYQQSDTAPWDDYTFNKLMIDPPRNGAIEVLNYLTADSAPERIVYVSCYPSTLARDSDHLVHNLGYRLESACVMDMFPQTSHVESMALFTRG